MNFHHFKENAALCAALAQQIERDLRTAIEEKGQASLAVSGGKTPLPLFEALNQIDLPWEKVNITLVDDRWVDEDHESSNEKLVKTHLLKNKAQKAHFIGLKTLGDSPFDHEADVEAQLRAFPFPLDVIVLGMGDDGHTASLFPNAQNLAKGLDLNSGKTVIAMTPLDAPFDRISLTLPVILSSKHVYVHLSGENKLKVLEKAVQGKDVNEMPIRAVLNAPHCDVEVYATP